MISTEMLARLRTLLDESSASFWTDTECYAALADGQTKIIDEVLRVYKMRLKIDPAFEVPEELRVLTTLAKGTIAASQINVPTGFIWLVNAKWDHDETGGEKSCLIVSQDRNYTHDQENSFLVADATSPISWVGPEQTSGVQSINFRPTYSSSATYTINYLKYPTAIASGQNPTLSENTHTAIVFYAAYWMLAKDQRPEEAMIHWNNYITELKSILGV